MLSPDRNDYYEYSDQDQIIVRAELVKPKPDVFGDHIKYVLVISTPLQVILLAVSTAQAQSSTTNLDTISLFATNMTLPADDEQMEQIGGTDDGRIFTIGKSGNVYEIEYHVGGGQPSHSVCVRERETKQRVNRIQPSGLQGDADSSSDQDPRS